MTSVRIITCLELATDFPDFKVLGTRNRSGIIGHQPHPVSQ